jgi:hypothetical protein
VLKQVFRDKGLSMGIISTFSYGLHIDDLIGKLSPIFFELTGGQSNLPKLIIKNRNSYMLIAPEEIDNVIKSAGYKREQFLSIKMTDISEGNKRYLIFNKNVGDDTVRKVNYSIRKLVSLNP